MNSTEYFNRMIDFREDTSLYLKEVLLVLDAYRGLSFTETSKYDFTPQYFENKLIRKALELQGCNFAFNYFQNNPFILSAKTIKKVHQMAFKYCTGSKRKGRFIHTTNDMIFPLKIGGALRIYTALPGEVNSHMDRLITWTNQQLREKVIHPLIVIALFKYEYVSIHPFDNGNGRTSRILTSLLLRNAGYQITYHDLETAVNKNRATYYGTLSHSQLRRGKQEEKIDAWMLYFTSGLQHIIKSKSKPH